LELTTTTSDKKYNNFIVYFNNFNIELSLSLILYYFLELTTTTSA
jgi:hypothetical protein